MPHGHQYQSVASLLTRDPVACHDSVGLFRNSPKHRIVLLPITEDGVELLIRYTSEMPELYGIGRQGLVRMTKTL